MRAIRNIVVVLLSAFAVVGAVDQARHLDKSMTKGPKLAKKTKGPSMSKLTTKAPTIKGSKKATLPPALTAILQTFFIEIITTDGTTPSQADINLLAADLVLSYNELVQTYTNPQALVMTTVTAAALIQGGITRRELQNTKAIAKVDVEGTCNGCGTDGRFTKNDSRRLQTLIAGLPAEIDLQVSLDTTVQANTGYTSIVALSNLEEEQPIAPTTATTAPVGTSLPTPSPKATVAPVAVTPPPTAKSVTSAPTIPKTTVSPVATVAPVAVTSPAPTAKTTNAPVGATSFPTVSKALTSTPAPSTAATKSVTTTAPVTTTTAPVTTTIAPTATATKSVTTTAPVAATTAPVTTTIAPTATATKA